MTERVQTLLEAPSPAVLTTYRKDGSAFVSPAWFRKAVPPFRGVELRGIPELVGGDVTEVREAIAGRYLGVEAGRRFAAERCSAVLR